MLETQYSKDIAALKIHKEENLNVKTQEDELKISNTLILPEGKITFDHITYFQKIIPKVELKKSNQKKNPKAVFILAPPRSGTTLLRVMLAGHPRLFAANELQLLGFNDLKERNEAYQGKFSLWSEGLIRVIMELKNCTAEAAKKQVINYVQKGWTTQRMFLEIQNSVDPQILVDKSPSYALDLKSLLKAEEDFQDAIFIQLVRHPYSMVKSFEKYHMDQVLHLDEHHFSSKQLGELVWLESHNNINKFFDSIPRHRKIQIQYEELVTQPAKVMWELCKKIGIPFHDDTLNPYADLDKKMTNGLYPDSRSMGDINFDKQSKINADKATEWKGVLNDSFLCEKTLALTASFGYEVYEKKGKSITQKDERLFKIKNLDPKSNEEVKSNDIAIIGMAVRVAGANTLEQFWENLMEGVDVSKELNVNDLKQENVNRAYCLDDPDKFDAAFFGIMPKEAEMMDPQHRVFLEVAYSALQNAGYNPKNYDGKIGVFGGVSRNAYFSNNIASNPERLKAAGDYMDMIGSEKSFSVSRVAYKLNLQGPAVNVQTACSSSGVAVHLGCQSILNGDSDIVLIGGGRIQPPMDNGYEYKEGGPLSPDGYIRAFDSNAKGMVQGHGMVMIAMKKLEKAIENGDYIWSIIKGTAINNDGSDKIGFTAPSIKGQSEAILKAQEKAGVTADSISYIEAHGTGTILGDPIEIEGLTQAYRHSTNKNQFCAIGSVKTNIGHLDAGACVAGIIKTSLALKYKQIPPSLNFDQPNPQIDFQNSPFFVNNQLRDWKQHGNPRRAGVSSFGLGGTNAHVILEEAPSEYNKSNLNGSGGASEILLFSGKTEKASSELSNSTEVSCTFSKNASYTLAIGREHFQYRTAKIGSISNLKNGSKKPITVTGNSDKANHKIVFLFPGGGSQYLNMGYDLYESMPVFRNYVDDCIALLKKNQGVEIDHFLLGSKNDNTQNALALQSPSIALPTLFTIEYALGKMWMDIGIMPNEMMGHSMGEYTAACLSGVMSLKDALALVTVRGKLFEQLPKQGGMLSVPISEKEVGHFLENELSVAVVNKPDNCVVSGNLTSINKLQQKLENEGIEAKKIHISVAAHSKQVELILEPFQAFFENIKLNKPQIPYISNVTGSWVKEEEATSPEFWVKHLRQTVRFSDGLTTVFENPKKILLEIGPGQTLSTFAKTHPDKNSKQLILATLRHPKELQNDLTFLQKTIGKLWVSGKEVNWEKYFEGRNVGRIPMPTYPFERKRFWIMPSAHQHPLVDSQRPNNSVSEDLELIPETIENSNNSEILNMNTTETRVEILITEIKAILYELSGIGPEEMDVEATYLELGFDSLFLSQAVIQLNKKLNLNLSFRQMFEETPTILSLVEYADELLPKEMFQPAIKKEEVFYSSPTIEEEGVQGQIGDSPIEQIIRHQLQVMEQQLAIIKNGNQNINGNKIINNQPSQNTAKKERLSINSEEKVIERKVKGVTAKLNNYKKITAVDNLTQAQQDALDQFMKAYISMTQKSKNQAQKHREFYADPRSVTGFSKLWKEIVYQISAERSKGSKIWDIDGNEYIDFVMSYGVALFGHAPDFVQKAIIEQVEKGNSLDLLPPKATEIARMICEMSGMDRVTLANTGTEAVLGAVRAARTYTGKEKIAVFDTDYHGLIGQFMLRGVHLKDRTNVLPAAAGIPSFVVKDTLVLDYDDEMVMDKLEVEIKNLAAIIIEPVQAQNPHWQHFELLRKIRALTAKHDVPLIFDEIINGFRLDQKGAQAWYKIEADIVAFGKSVSGGLPLSAVAGKAKYMDAFDGGKWQYGDDSGPESTMTYFASTFIKNPISVAGAYAAVLELYNRGANFQYELNAKTAKFADQVKEIFLRTKAPIFIQCTASMFMVKPADSNPFTRLFHYFLRMEGVNFRERPCFISLAHTESDLEKTFQAIEMAIEKMFATGLVQPYEGEDLNLIVLPPKHLQKGKFWDNQTIELPLTEGQKEVFVSAQFGDEANAAYNIGTEISLEGSINLNQIKNAVLHVVDRHEALRIQFARDGQKQFIRNSINVEVPFEDLSHLNKGELEKELNKLHLTFANMPFDLVNEPLFRIKIIRENSQKHLLLLTVHHAIADGWSLGILTRDLGQFLKQELGEKINLQNPFPFSSYVQAQLKFQSTKEFEKTTNYWKNQFNGSITALNLTTDFARPNFQTYNADCQRIKFSSKEFNDIQKAASKSKSTLYFFLFGAFQTFISRVTQQDDLTIGIVAANQNTLENAQMVGHAANLLPIRMEVNQTMAFSNHLKSVRSCLLDAFDHQNFTFGELVKQLRLERDTSKNPLVSIVFNLDAPLNDLDYGRLHATTRPIEKQYETFDLFINVKPVNDCLLFEWFYNTDLYKKQTILNYLIEFKTYINGILDNPNEEILNLPLLPVKYLRGNSENPPISPKGEVPPMSMTPPPAPKEEHQRATKNQNISIPLGAGGENGQSFTLSKLFENQALKTPNSTAIIFGSQNFSYQQINERANQIAHKLIEKGVQPNTFVGMFLERTPDLIASILGVLKTGAAYLPLDTMNPTERLKVIIEDVNADFILTHSELENQLPKGHHKYIFTDEIQDCESNLRQNLNIEITESANSYIIYTSGSTGKPKGVTITHGQISKHLISMIEYLKFDENQVMFSVISSSFDPSVQDFFLPLITGAKIILNDQNTIKDGYLLRQKLNASDATMMVATPATWRILLTSGWKGKSDLTIISTGEALSKKLAGELMNCGEDLWNFYGPTETVIYAIAKKVTKEDLTENSLSNWVSIGAALPETVIYILDKNGQPLPTGTPGEIFIGGFRVAKGYYQRPEKTKEVFLNNPFNLGEQFYKTGDLGIMQDNGNILYINRMDNQVKLRGHRIELGEIEAKIRAFEGVNEAVVLLREDEPGDKKLVAYVKGESNLNLVTSDLRSFLVSQLPIYMIPSLFVEIEKFPLTTSGKINRRQLPKPVNILEKIYFENISEARTETEKFLSKIWCELLRIPEVGINDNFYDLGGHSLMAVGMMAKIEDEYEIRLPLVTFIENSTIEGIANKIDEGLGKSNGQTIDQIFEKGQLNKTENTTKLLPLTEGQKEVWVSHNLHEEAAKSFNLGTEIKLNGSVDVKQLKLAIYDLVDRHEALRTSIEPDGKQQKIHSKIDFDIPFLDWSGLSEEDRNEQLERLRKQEIERVFDLEKAPLATFHIVKMSPAPAKGEHLPIGPRAGGGSPLGAGGEKREFILLISMHHILLDGWSLGVLTNDLGLLYQKRIGKSNINLAQNSQLTDFVNYLDKWTKSTDYQESEAFWLKQFENGIPLLEFPTDKPIGKTNSFAADQSSIYFSDDFIKDLKVKAKQNNMTFYTFMFAAFQAFTARLAQQDEFVLGVSVSGKSIIRFNDLVAHRTNLLPLKINVNQTESFQNHLKIANRQLLTAFDHQDYTLGTLVKKLKVSRDTSRHPLVNVVFNMETMSREYDFGDLKIETEFIPGTFKTLDLIVHMKPNKLGYEFKWIFKNEIFEKEEVERRLAEFRAFLDGILANPELPIQEISVLPETEKAQILAFGKNEITLDFGLKCLHELFEDQVLKTPLKTALVYQDQSLTYFELNQRANRLARYLITNGLKTNDFVGICLDRSLDSIISIYAILKAGGTYVPLDPSNPKGRLKGIWEDSNCQMIMTHSHLLDRTSEYEGNCIVLDDQSNAIQKQNADNLRLTLSQFSNAYVIYTSGSTGKPKGVGIQHKSVVNTLFGINTHLEITSKDSFYSVSSMAFDMSIPDYFLSLTKGATLILAESATKKDGFLLKESIEKHKPTVMQATPTTWKILLLAGWAGNSDMQIIAGGEGFSRELAEALLSKGCRLFNGYGPTEGTIYSTYKEVNWHNISSVSALGFIPIGKPNPNVKCMILNERKELVPIGVAGELYIGGPGVARGYLNREELTKKVFLDGKNLNENAGLDKWYKTGDLVRWLPNGDIDFLGRIDNQVKIRGFRIELGEIEECLMDGEGVEQAVVSVFKDKSGRELLTAYVKMNPVSKMDEKVLKANLRKRLPGFMIPAIYVEMDEFPLTNSLKTDRKALPKPDLDSMVSEREFELPKSEIEEKLMLIWKEILGLKKVSTNEDFFELGGHSLVAVGLIARIQKDFGKKLPLTSLFQNSTIQKLADLIKGKGCDKNAKWSSLIPIRPEGKKAPIYLVHGGGLHVLFYQTLTKFLDKDQPVYALQAKGLNGIEEPLETIEEMAAHYIKEILEQNPTGPYNLAGYSLGGLIAYEMTRQLKALGKEVKVLAMLDAVARHETDSNSKFKKNLRKAKFYLELMMKDPINTAKYKAEVLKMQLLHKKGKVDMPFGETQINPSENAGHLAGKRVFEKSMAAFQNYLLKPSKVHIDLFKAKDQMFYLSDPDYYGWNKFAKHGVEVHEIEGNHMTLFEEKSGRIVADILQRCLDK